MTTWRYDDKVWGRQWPYSGNHSLWPPGANTSTCQPETVKIGRRQLLPKYYGMWEILYWYHYVQLCVDRFMKKIGWSTILSFKLIFRKNRGQRMFIVLLSEFYRRKRTNSYILGFSTHKQALLIDTRVKRNRAASLHCISHLEIHGCDVKSDQSPLRVQTVSLKARAR